MNKGKEQETYVPAPDGDPLRPPPPRRAGRDGGDGARDGRQQLLRVVVELDVQQHPDFLQPRLGQPRQQVGQTGQALARLAQRLQGAQVAPVAVGDLGVDAEAALEACVLAGS